MNAILSKISLILVSFVFLMGLTESRCGTTQLELGFEGLEPLGAEYVYEGWLIVDGEPVSSGRFNLRPGQSKVISHVSPSDLDQAAMFVLTIEPAHGDDPSPSATHVLAGAFEGSVAGLNAAHPAALGDDFTSASGGFILETPSTGSVADDYAQGIWFLDPSGPAVSLNLPTLPAGWVYEGWVAGPEGAISTGRFLDAGMADYDGAGDAAGPDGFPPFPGQDYIEPALNLVGMMAVISIEPDPDDSGAPFAFKPLVGVIDDAGRGGFQVQSNNAVSFVTGTAWRN